MITKRGLLLLSAGASTFDAFTTWLVFVVTRLGARGELNLVIRYLYNFFGVYSPFAYLPIEIVAIFYLSYMLMDSGFSLFPPTMVASFGFANLLGLAMFVSSL